MLKSGKPPSFKCIHPPVPHPSHTQMLSSGPSPLNTLNLRSSFSVRDRVLHPVKTIDKIIFSYNLIFTFLYSRREAKQSVNKRINTCATTYPHTQCLSIESLGFDPLHPQESDYSHISFLSLCSQTAGSYTSNTTPEPLFTPSASLHPSISYLIIGSFMNCTLRQILLGWL